MVGKLALSGARRGATGVVFGTLVMLGLALGVGAPADGLGIPSNTATLDGWTSEAVANPDYLSGVSCVSATFCVAVGWTTMANAPQEFLAEEWNGTSWTGMTPADSSAGINLWSVSCTSSSFCMAVGDDGTQTYAAAWNGATWSTVPAVSLNPPRLYSNVLSAVSCASPSRCVAIGFEHNFQDGGQPLVEQWDGTAWTLDSTFPLTKYSVLQAVSCPSVTFCMITGVAAPSIPAWTWNGSTWTARPYTQTQASSDFIPTAPTAVTCTSATTCMVAGPTLDLFVPGGPPPSHQPALLDFQFTAAAKWNGSSWATRGLLTMPSWIGGMSCATANFCVAAGAPNAAGSAAELWNGLIWIPLLTENPGATSTFTSVSCPSTKFCMAVGEDGSSAFAEAYQPGLVP
ncbi:MAG TPA: hypothetical protein VE991_14880 [Acidimicrobiales bacterium]|nr:hypothetical protein [Acidimicrobiales bacterium]